MIANAFSEYDFFFPKILNFGKKQYLKKTKIQKMPNKIPKTEKYISKRG